MELFGFVYQKEASFRTTTNWVCIRNGRKGDTLLGDRCQARVVQRMDDGALKLNRHTHNHHPEQQY
ncbi:Mod(mdg4)-h55.7c [Anopheles sinensis]|uniref:FLYWCH-type domain-containing protein n=1 Tax=Anopheles sinensis TaxID=74873 RepID=A0A084WSS3_ANOSI|nr:Mod(mdg4)-h55.7c [Anopheles sinensis]